MDQYLPTDKRKFFPPIPKQQLLQIFGSLLILLWAYTAGSKLAAMEEFEKELKNQVFSDSISNQLIWLLPITELLAAGLLLFTAARKIGFMLSTLLMAVFTIYIALVLGGYFHKFPCSCGGVLKELGWQAHLWFNLFFLSISAAGIWLSTNVTASPSKHQQKSAIQRRPKL
ncbi:MAG: hypothetical protein EOO90_03690 [Pedobacter sp.]|nr:MAG: hypothetical protein EOO90_03690 [Pedobacter sp.]